MKSVVSVQPGLPRLDLSNGFENCLQSPPDTAWREHTGVRGSHAEVRIVTQIAFLNALVSKS